MTEIRSVPEALKLLKTLVERGDGEANYSPWCLQCRSYNTFKDHKCVDCGSQARVINVWLVAGAKVARAVLKECKEGPGSTNEDWQAGLDDMVEVIANSYRPALVELGWWPK